MKYKSFPKGVDPFTMSAHFTFKIPVEEIQYHHRYAVKVLGYINIYGKEPTAKQLEKSCPDSLCPEYQAHLDYLKS